MKAYKEKCVLRLGCWALAAWRLALTLRNGDAFVQVLAGWRTSRSASRVLLPGLVPLPTWSDHTHLEQQQYFVVLACLRSDARCISCYAISSLKEYAASRNHEMLSVSLSTSIGVTRHLEGCGIPPFSAGGFLRCSHECVFRKRLFFTPLGPRLKQY
jgi:hypothetical protein